MMIITVGNTKGGVGKTMLALNLAVARARQGREVWFIDGDRQGTGQAAIENRAIFGQDPGLSCAQYYNGATLRTQIKQQRKHFDDIVIDAGGRDSSALRSALMLTDLLIIPFQPRSYDVWALKDMVELVEEAQSLRDGLVCHAVLNMADPGESASDNREAAAAAREFPVLQYLDAPLRKRKAFANAAGDGRSVLEATPRDAKACRELEKLLSKLFPSLKKSKAARTMRRKRNEIGHHSSQV